MEVEGGDGFFVVFVPALLVRGLVGLVHLYADEVDGPGAEFIVGGGDGLVGGDVPEGAAGGAVGTEGLAAAGSPGSRAFTDVDVSE